MQLRALAVIGSLLLAHSFAAAGDFYVSPRGDDASPGTLEKPFATLARAQQAVREAKKSEAGPHRVFLRGGVYYLPQTLVLTADDSGTKDSPIVWSAYRDEKPVLSGGQPLSLRWEPYRNGIQKAAVPEGFATDQLFVNGQNQPMARYPNFNPKVAVFNGFSWDCTDPKRVAKWADPTGGFIHAMHKASWGGMHYRITGKNADGTLAYEGGWQNNRPMGMHPHHRFVENIFEELDAPSEWFLNAKTNTLYYYPPAGVDLATAKIEGVRLPCLVEFRGTQRSPVRFVALKGLTFRHAARTFMETKEPLLRTDWAVYRGGAVLLTGTEDCSLEDCDVDHVGGNAVFVNNYNRRAVVRGCHIYEVGASGVLVTGDRAAGRVPMDWNDKSQQLDKLDRTPGPKTDNYPADCTIDDCLIHDIGRVEKQPAGVGIDLAQDIRVLHCTIYNCPRSGINIGDGCWGGHRIDGCDVFNTVLETGDHGSFNSWGRDRFWSLAGLNFKDERVLEAEKDLPFLDAMKTTTICNSRWRCDHGWDIDLDDGSSNYHIYNNLCLRGGLKNREGFRRVVENNIMVGNGFHPHVWYKRSGDVFAHNILVAHYPIGMPEVWGRQIDYNSYPDQGRLLSAQVLGGDKNSTAGEPGYVDPKSGDFSVKADSPALKVGFKNFPMDQFGVRSPRLKALAQAPVFPDGKTPPAPPRSKRDSRKAQWLGATVKSVTELGEVSVGGLPGTIGVIVLDVPAKSDAANAGLRSADIITKWNGRPLDDLPALEKLYNDLPGGAKAELGVVREQKLLKITISGAMFKRRTDHRSILEQRKETQQQRDARMKWWRDARYGMFIHWGLYAVPAGTHEGRRIDNIGEWIMEKAHIPVARYAEYAKEFNPTKFDADQWVRIAKQAGMKYIVITAKHHEGFAMYRTKVSPFNIVDATPFRRDPLAELAAACRKEGIQLGFYYSQAQDWHQPGASTWSGKHWDPVQDGDMDQYIDKIAVPQVRELLSNYGEFPAVLWWDTPYQMTRQRADRLYKAAIEIKPNVIMNDRLGPGYHNDFAVREGNVPASVTQDRDWETCDGIANGTWGYKSYTSSWKSSQYLVRRLIETASKGGNFLLNVAPTGEGEIPAQERQRLAEIGQWLKVNGEAIYGTSASPFAQELKWGRATWKGRMLYCFVLDLPADRRLLLPGLKRPIKAAWLLADPKKTALPVASNADGATLTVPDGAIFDPYATVIAVEMAE